VSLGVHLRNTPLDLTKFSVHVDVVAIVWSSSGSIVICFVLLVLWMM